MPRYSHVTFPDFHGKSSYSSGFRQPQSLRFSFWGLLSGVRRYYCYYCCCRCYYCYYCYCCFDVFVIFIVFVVFIVSVVTAVIIALIWFWSLLLLYFYIIALYRFLFNASPYEYIILLLLCAYYNMNWHKSHETIL